ncbi:MAG: helix-turn-helix domain-containing protein [Blastocatellia bacterium]
MGHTAEKPKRLAGKLLQIRESLGLSQNGLIEHLGLTGQLSQGKISEYETGRREPSLLVLLRYARTAGVPMDDLVDDEVDLPRKVPTVPKRKG